MTTGNTVYGDIITFAEEGEFDIIVHGCNLHGVMGAGVARQIADKYPEALIADRASLHLPERLGAYTFVPVQSPQGHRFIIVNGYTQRNHGTDRRQVDYDAVTSVFQLVRANFGEHRIAYPRIGAGLAGGDWNILKGIIDTTLDGTDHTLVEYQPARARFGY